MENKHHQNIGNLPKFFMPSDQFCILCTIFVINCTFFYCTFFILYKWTISPTCQSSPQKTSVLIIGTIRHLFFKINTSMLFRMCYLASEWERDQRDFKTNHALGRKSLESYQSDRRRPGWQDVGLHLQIKQGPTSECPRASSCRRSHRKQLYHPVNVGNKIKA